jgi:Oligoribonuclease (3''->5'' exoribonuclease)
MDKKQRNKKQKHVLWIDLEMTGLDPVEDRILEVGAIITDWDFKEVVTYEAAIKVGPRLVEKRMFKGPAADFWTSVPETRDALIKQNLETGRSGRIIENELLSLLDEHFEKDIPIILAGNSIHMDRRFIENEWPRLNKRLHYRMLDVSAWKVVFEGKFGKRFAKREAHRALDDIRGSIEELRYYLTKVKKAS